jgi:hypothetical protein
MRLTVFSRRWGHNDSYNVEITNTGWEISHVAIGGACDSFGKPYLFGNLNHDSINYPEDLGGYMDWLWRQAKSQNMDETQIQRHLDELGAWIQSTEQNTPRGLWQQFK